MLFCMSRSPAVTGERGLVGRLDDQFRGAKLVGGMLAVMWGAFIVDTIDSHHLDNSLGIQPRSVSHLWDILTAPFLHANFGHIFGNSIPFVILGLMIAASGLKRLGIVTVISIIVSGAGVWLTASANSRTIGMSGVIFGFATYLIARGIFDHKLRELLVGAVVGVLFGLSLLSDLVPRSGISWQAHLFGGIGGVLAAAVLAEKRESAPSADIATT
jgi:membrane associated rhomboid family serine protease